MRFLGLFCILDQLVNHGHVLKEGTIVVLLAIVEIEAMSEVFALGVDLVQNHVRKAGGVVAENGNLTVLLKF